MYDARKAAPLLGLATLAALSLAAAHPAAAQDTGTLNGAYYNVGQSLYAPGYSLNNMGAGRQLPGVVEYLEGQTPVYRGDYPYSGSDKTTVSTFSLTGNSPTPTTTFTVSQSDLANGLNLGTLTHGADNSVLVLTGYVDAPTAGAYAISGPADDEEAIYINGGLQYDTNYFAGPSSGTLTLNQGLNHIDLIYYQGYGGQYAYANFNPNGGADLSLTATPAPEPSSVAAFAFAGLGTLGLILKARKRKTMPAA